MLLVGMNLLWAGSYSIFRTLTEQEHLSSGTITTLRFGLAAICLLAAWPWLPGRGPKLGDLWRVVLLGAVVFCLAPRLQVEAVHQSQAGDASLLMALDPLITALAAAIFLAEKIPARRWWGCGLGMLGVVLLSKVWWNEAQPLEGLLANVFFIASMFCEAGYSVLGKPLLGRVGALKLLGSGLIAGTFINLLWDGLIGGTDNLAVAKTMSVSAWLFIIYLAVICTVVGYSLWYVVIRETEVNVTGLTVLVQPLAGWAISILWLKEALHWGQLWGSVAIVGGLIIGLRRGGRVRLEIEKDLEPTPKIEPVVD